MSRSRPAFVLALGLPVLVGFMPLRARALTLGECLAAAGSAAPDLREARLALEARAAEASAADAGRLPAFSAVVVYNKSDDIATQLPDANNAGFQVQQDLLPYGPEFLGAQEARQALATAALGLSDTAGDMALRVELAYDGVLQGRADLAALAAAEAEVGRLKSERPPRFQPGGGPDLDLVKVLTTQAELERRADRARSRRDEAARELALLIGAGSVDPGSLEDRTPPVAPAEPDWPGTVPARLDRSRVRQAEIGLRSADAALLPTLSAVADWGDAGQDWNSMTPGWGVAVTANVPLFEFGHLSARARAARLDLARARAAERDAGLRRRADWAALSERVRNLGRDRRRLAGLLPVLRAAARAAVRRYGRGGLAVLDATDAVAGWLEGRERASEDLYGACDAVARMRRLAGEAAP